MRHGKSGNVPFENVNRCPFKHPKLCEKVLENAYHDRGCKRRDCKYEHPKICGGSLHKRECNKSGKEFGYGYHLSNTKIVDSKSDNKSNLESNVKKRKEGNDNGKNKRKNREEVIAADGDVIEDEERDNKKDEFGSFLE